MLLELFINFDGNCREAANFYAKVFKSSVNNLMTYSDAPPDPSFPLSPADKDKICYAGIPMGNTTLMLMDFPSGSQVIKGNTINPTVSLDNKDDITRIFNELKEGGEVYMELQKTFYSELYGMVKDKFGVIWNILHYAQES